jgi:ribose 1,5-bisphosphokinase
LASKLFSAPAPNALRRAINDDIRAGRAVVANISRTIVEAMRCVYAELAVVSITAPPEILSQRLVARTRDSSIEAVVRRAA